MYENVPLELKQMKQWVCYRAIQKGERVAKVPVHPSDGKAMDINNKENWFTFDEVVQEIINENDHVSGIGFVFSESDHYVGIDLDYCINEEGNFSSLAQEVISMFVGKAYIEFSPSMRGIHIIAKGKKTCELSKNTKLGIEVYDQKRYFTVTGNQISSAAILFECQKELQAIYEKYLIKKEDDTRMTTMTKNKKASNTLTEDQLLDIMFSRKGGDRLRSLFDGNWESYYSSQSEADLALCNALAFYTAKDANEMDRLFRKSGLFRVKWDQIHFSDGRTYGDSVIEKAIADTTIVFSNEAIQSKSNKVVTEKLSKKIPPWYEQNNNSLRFMSGVLAKHLAETYDFIYSSSQFFKYENGVYKEIETLKVERFIQEHLIVEYSKGSHIKDTLDQLKIRILYEEDLLDSSQLLNRINFKNGIFDLNTKALLPHTPLFYTAIQINAQYNPEAECPHFKHFIDTSLDSTDALIAQELMGYLLIPSTVAEKAFILYGPGRTGKSTFLKVIEKILGKNQISNVALQELSQRFKPSLLFGKLANIYADLPSKNIEDTGIFKTVVSGDSIVAERKFGDPFSFSNNARLMSYQTIMLTVQMVFIEDLLFSRF